MRNKITLHIFPSVYFFAIIQKLMYRMIKKKLTVTLKDKINMKMVTSNGYKCMRVTTMQLIMRQPMFTTLCQLDMNLTMEALFELKNRTLQ